MNDIMSDSVVNAMSEIKLLINEGNNRTVEQIKSLEQKIDNLSEKQNDMSTRLILAETKIDSTKKSLDENWEKTRKYDEKLVSLKESSDEKLLKLKEDIAKDISSLSKNQWKVIGALSVIAGAIQLGIIKLT